MAKFEIKDGVADYYIQRLPKALHGKIVELAPEKKQAKKNREV